jgi:hypothetical protein
MKKKYVVTYVGSPMTIIPKIDDLKYVSGH